MEDKLILEVIKAFDSSSAVSIKYKQGDTFLSLKKREAFVENKEQNLISIPCKESINLKEESINTILNTKSEVNSNQLELENSVQESIHIIKSPIVGTFYRAPSPDAPVYCEIGKTIKKGQPICILEAMKMMNTLEAEYDCIVEDILVDNGELVEFEQPIFKVKKV